MAGKIVYEYETITDSLSPLCDYDDMMVWTPPRPLTQEEYARLTCPDCGEFSPHTFVVHDELWQSVCPPNTQMCCSCFEKRIGRPLNKTDLKPGLGVTDYLEMGYRIFSQPIPQGG